MHPELDVVGSYVHRKDRVGRDAGELADEKEYIGKKRLGRIGVITTDKWDELLALEPDCLAYFGNGRDRELEVAQEMIPFLKRGTNVVTVSLLPMTYAPGAPAMLRVPLEQACATGRSSFYNGGIDHGFANGTMAFSMLAVAGEVKSVRMQEIADYGQYPVEWLMRDTFVSVSVARSIIKDRSSKAQALYIGGEAH